VPDSLLTILKFCFLALLYLFFVRVLRAVWAEMREPAAAAVAVPAAAAAAPASARPTAARQTWATKGGSRLRVVEPADTRGQTYDLGDELTLGRAAGCQVTIDDTFVSQLHARLFRRAAPVAIRKGDRLQVGKTVLELI